ncbi:P-selectin-like [Styela clava]
MNIFLSVFVSLLVVYLNVSLVQGIKCWTCDGKNSLKECHAQYGKMLECSQPDHVCQNDYRTVRGKPLIIKGCKQERACITEVKQNKNDNQCGRVRLLKNLVCRCCCSFSGCNSKESGCLPPPAPCKRIQSIRNGRTYCPHGEIKFGTQCSFSCNNGFELVGKKTATCRPLGKGSKKGKWIPEELPFCKKIIIKCEPPRTAPESGFLSCKNSKEYAKFDGFNYAGSTCTYACEQNYYVAGKRITQCEFNRDWNNPPPTCKVGICEPEKEDPNRIEKCTNGNMFGSSCTFECKEGFNLIGHKKSDCAQIGYSEKGFWTKRFPRCAKIICFPEYTKFTQGTVKCSDNNFKDSVCTFTCNFGYDITETEKPFKEIICQDDDTADTKGQWSGNPPVCEQITCKPALHDPQNGQVACSNKNNIGSNCTFSCNEGYDLDGTVESSIESLCRDDGDGDEVGEWTVPEATCSPITCKPAASNPSDGYVRCTNRNFHKSTCSYECEDDYDLDDTNDLVALRTCEDSGKGVAEGEWSGKPPTCSTIICEPLPEFRDGFRFCSMQGGLSGAFCVMSCNDGYEAIGKTYISCSNLKRDGDAVGEWSDTPAVCELSYCEPPKYDASTVVQNCKAPKGYAIDEYRVGTVCEYKCINEGYYMVPNTGDEVVLQGFIRDRCNVNKKWSNRPPRCFPKTCLPPITTLENGHTPKCTNGNTFNSRCRFECLAKYGLTHENPLVCRADDDNDQYGKWSEEIPKCERNECDEFGIINNGKLNCSNGLKIGSTCDLTCIDKYTQKRYEQITCMPSAEWSQTKFVCCVRCLFNKRLNILTMFDSTAFTTQKDWQYIVQLMEKTINRMLYFRLDVGFGAARYAEVVDTESAVEKVRMRYTEHFIPVAEQIKNMPITGREANLGAALTYANDVYFKTTDRRREQFLILFTSGSGIMNNAVVEQAKIIRQRGINILVVAFNANKSASKTLLDISGLERNMISASNLEDLARLSEQISVISMTTGCTSASKSQPCS